MNSKDFLFKVSILVFLLVAVGFSGCSETGGQQSEYQDEHWISRANTNTQLVSSNLQHLDEAMRVNNYGDMYFYAEKVIEYTEKALEDSEKYEVSPELEQAQIKYKEMMQQAANGAQFVQEAVEAHRSGDAPFESQKIGQANSCFLKGSELAEEYNNCVPLKYYS